MPCVLNRISLFSKQMVRTRSNEVRDTKLLFEERAQYRGQVMSRGLR